MLYIKFDSFDDIEVMGGKKDHGIFVLIMDDNVHAECEKCGAIENIILLSVLLSCQYRQELPSKKAMNFVENTWKKSNN